MTAENDIGEVIRCARMRRRWTQRQLAERSGIQQPIISRVERGTTKRYDILVSLLDALGLPIARSLHGAVRKDR